MSLLFKQLNDGWNADPNAPGEQVSLIDGNLILSFRLNWQAYDAQRRERGRLLFPGVRRFRLGPENDHAWFDGNGRYSGVAPQWGEFYEISGEVEANLPTDGWVVVGEGGQDGRHFLFFLRDTTFECFADDWSFERDRG